MTVVRGPLRGRDPPPLMAHNRAVGCFFMFSEQLFYCKTSAIQSVFFSQFFILQKMPIWVNKVNRMIWVWVRMWRMEKVPGHGLCTANRPAGRPAHRQNIPVPVPALVPYPFPLSIICRMALIPYFESRSVVDFTYRKRGLWGL